jgi:mRNA interferase YafQ
MRKRKRNVPQTGNLNPAAAQPRELRAAYGAHFERDLKQMLKRGKDVEKIKAVIRMICSLTPLPQRFVDHPLHGEWKGCRDCHVEPDWVLIYAVEKGVAKFIRTGTHSDLFG